MCRAHLLTRLALFATVLLAVPLSSHGGAPCDNATTSLQSTLNDPVAGDEKFFTLPIGPSNVMFLLDVSGSMDQLPQCGDDAWGGGTAACTNPTFSITAPAAGTAAAVGTCSPGGDLAWMNNYTPTTTLVDPGRGTAAFGTKNLVDTPPWGSTCGDTNNCLFRPTKNYTYGSWDETSATAMTTDPCAAITVSYTEQSCSGTNVVSTGKTLTVTPPNCSTCLSSAGFYFWAYEYSYHTAKTTGSGSNKKCTQSTATSSVTSNGPYFTGAWLNANPPKFMSARKVIKDTAWIDPGGSTASTDQLRIGLAYFSSGITNSAAIIVPLGPSKVDSYPPNQSAYVTARQLILDAVNHTHGGAAGWPSGVTLPALANGSTPMATALFHVGQYFTASGVYTSKFGSSSYELSAFAPGTIGSMKASWSNSDSFCWSCQKSAIIMVTDGSPNSEGTLPSSFKCSGASTGCYDQNVYTLAANCGSGTGCGTGASKCCSPTDTTAPSYVPRVAGWLYENDLYTSLDKKQSVMTNTVSFNLPPGNAQTILKATANMGGGTFNNAADGAALAAAVAQAINSVSNSSTSFGAPAATALTTINAVDTKAFITRFKPSQKATWEGHLFEWMLFDEAAAGCDPTKSPDPLDTTQQIECQGKSVMRNFNGDTVKGFNNCTGSFLVDKECDEVYEDQSTGIWYKKGSGGIPAIKFWDAGEVLSTPTADGYRTAAEHDDPGNIAPVSKYAPGKTARNLWAALPDGTMLELETKNAAQLAPYMNLDKTWCSNMESTAKLCGTSPTCPVTSGTDWQTYCAQQVILFARGWDVLNQDGDSCYGPGNPNNGTTGANTLADGTTTTCVLGTVGGVNYAGEERNRINDAGAAGSSPVPSFYKLGDVFHSAPVLVHPPVSEAICRLGTDNQCVRTLFAYVDQAKYGQGYQTPLDTYDACPKDTGQVDAYRAWRTQYADRDNVVVVGANDGFLHAFDAGGPDTGTGSTQDKDCAWSNVKNGTGSELWGFLPPDLLPKLKGMFYDHQYMVDGNIMVRDIWVDGAPADGSLGNPVPSDGNALDGRKQKNEFRTVVVFGERAGGTQFTALDVTNAFSTSTGSRPRPTMRWTFPAPRSDDAQYMGQSWSDFAPRPPPIGPVRLRAESGDKRTGLWIPDPVGAPTVSEGFLEKWIVMLNGGYDPTLTRGRAVWTVDAWTGKTLWRFTDSDFKSKVLGSATATAPSMFPVPAGVGMVDIGDPAAGFDADDFFDTATWGDMGGNVFVARFDYPGVRNGSGIVQNWKAARTFEQGRRTDDAQYATNRTEFFYMTSNSYEPQRHVLRTLLGSGNREQILEEGQGCGPDNLMSCCQSGCTVSTSSTLDYGVCSSSASFACAAGKMTSPPLTQGCGGTGASACTGGSGTFTSTANYTLNCGASATTSATGTATCDSSGLCTVTPVGTGHDVTPSTTGTCVKNAKFFGFWAYGGLNVPVKAFATTPTSDWTTALQFDRNRSTDVAYTISSVCQYTKNKSCSLIDTTQASVDAKGNVTCPSATQCQATIDDPGWFYAYNSGNCPTLASCATGCTNEKTASGSAIVNSCATWNTLIPKGSAGGGSDPCSGAKTATQTAIAYASGYVTGVQDGVCNQGVVDPVAYRGVQRDTIAPPAAPMVRMGVSNTGRVYYSTLQLDPGSAPANSALGGRDIASPLYWLQVSKSAHDCRHTGTGKSSCN